MAEGQEEEKKIEKSTKIKKMEKNPCSIGK